MLETAHLRGGWKRIRFPVSIRDITLSTAVETLVHCTPLPISFPHHIEIKPKSKQTDRLFSTLHSVTMCGMTMAEPANCSIKSVYARAAKKRSECQTDRQPTASQRSNRGG